MHVSESSDAPWSGMRTPFLMSSSLVCLVEIFLSRTKRWTSWSECDSQPDFHCSSALLCISLATAVYTETCAEKHCTIVSFHHLLHKTWLLSIPCTAHDGLTHQVLNAELSRPAAATVVAVFIFLEVLINLPWTQWSASDESLKNKTRQDTYIQTHKQSDATQLREALLSVFTCLFFFPSHHISSESARAEETYCLSLSF